jgi:lysophospholipase L1-like esterase
MADMPADANASARSTSPQRRTFLIGLGATIGGAWGMPRAVAEPTAAAAATRREPGLAGIKALLAGKEPVTWVFTGDSITHGALHTLGWRSYPEHFAERVRWEMRRMRDVVINTGISGDRTGGLLRDLEWRVLRFKGDVVSLMYGMNDCTAGMAGREAFRRNCEALVDKIVAAGAIPILNTPNTVYVEKSPGRQDLEAYAAVVRELAVTRKLPLVDHWQHWQKTKPKQADLLAWLEDQSIHPGVYGHREFAKLIFRELGIFDAGSPTCKLEVP